ncbi:L-aspartate oxidase [Pelomyxa schiedti]|nr:L-aspartate oxidase [Pelomyxa schiedti]
MSTEIRRSPSPPVATSEPEPPTKSMSAIHLEALPITTSASSSTATSTSTSTSATGSTPDPLVGETFTCDYLVIGSGLAGLLAAVKASEHGDVICITKKTLQDCNTMHAQGGIACVTLPTDTVESHVNDTLRAGAGLCNIEAVEHIARTAPARLEDLIKLGVKFTQRQAVRQGEVEDTECGVSADSYDLGKEGGHSRRRILHAGDITGQEVMRALIEACTGKKNLKILQNHIAVDLISTEKFGWPGQNACVGAYVLERFTNKVHTVLSKYTFLATGGAGKVYLYTSNPDVASGDGIAMAYRVYAEINNMEFYQFHPTCLFHPHAKNFLISEALRGENAKLKIRNATGDLVEFMSQYHPMADLAPRDVVARAIDKELKRTGADCVYLDIRCHTEEFLRARFPNIFNKLLQFGINMAHDLIPVVPAAHYCCGGIRATVAGVTNVKNLYALGECSSTGLHGANRLASNSLLECCVMAHEAVQHTLTASPVVITPPIFSCGPITGPKDLVELIPKWSSGPACDSDEAVVISHNWDEIRRFMWDYVGIFRTTKRLLRAKNRIVLLRKEIEQYYWDFRITPDLVELRNLASIAEMIIDSALKRKESIGLHYNADFPPPEGEIPKGPHWVKNSVLKRARVVHHSYYLSCFLPPGESAISEPTLGDHS